MGGGQEGDGSYPGKITDPDAKKTYNGTIGVSGDTAGAQGLPDEGGLRVPEMVAPAGRRSCDPRLRNDRTCRDRATTALG